MLQPQTILFMLYDNRIAIYLLLEEILQAIEDKAPPHRQVNDGMVMTTALVGAWYFGGNWETARSDMQSHHCPKMLSKSRFNRRLHTLSLCCQQCFGLLGWVFKSSQTRQHYVLDTFPLALSDNIPPCRLLQGEDYRGSNASKREYFYG